MASEMLIRCRFSDSGRGFGFAIPLEGEGEDLYIAPEDTLSAMSGDTVLVRAYRRGERGYRRGGEGAVTRIVEHANTEIIGTFSFMGAFGVVTPDNEKLHATVSVHGADTAGAKPGDKVAVRITDFPRRRRGEEDFRLEGYVTKVFGAAETREANYEAILHRCGIPQSFSEDALWEADDVSARPLTLAGREDCRNICTMTIDGAGAKDLDDAISVSRTQDGWQLAVHIADVSEYVREDGAIDRDAYARGTSVYFVDKVVPMLPVALSNGICSLNGGEDRYALSALLDIAPDGTMRSCDFKKTMIRSDIRGVYSEVNDILACGRDSAFARKYIAVLPMLEEMHALYEALRGAAERRGYLTLESVEAEILLDGKGIPQDIVPRTRGVAEMMIEQFMLAANIGAATWLRARSLPCLYRVHDDPMPEKIRAFTVFAHNMGLDITGIDENVRPLRLEALLREAEEKGIAESVSGVLLRSLAKAKYSEKPGGHYGIAAELYCHFTSPIRRYPDLFVHRAISSVLSGMRRPSHPAESARVTSDCEVRAVTAERDIEDLYMAQYASLHIGEEYEATVTSVCSFGVFARTDKLFEGLLPVEVLFPDRARAEHSEEMMTLTAAGITYRLGDRVTVRVEKADVTDGKIDLALAGESEEKRLAAARPAPRPAYSERPGGSRPFSGRGNGKPSHGKSDRTNKRGGRSYRPGKPSHHSHRTKKTR